MAIKLQKHERAAVERARLEAAVYGCLVTYEPHGGRTHLRIRIVDPKSGGEALTTVASSPRDRDTTVKNVGKEVRRLCRALTR